MWEKAEKIKTNKKEIEEKWKKKMKETEINFVNERK